MSWQGCQKLVVVQTSDWPQNSDPPVATGGVFGAYRAVDDGQMSPTPVRFDAFVTQISDMWATDMLRAPDDYNAAVRAFID